MRSEPRQLDGDAFDLVVVGAGIQGAAIARDAALRGLRVAIVDARDVAAGTSSRSSRLVHGGLRYLRHGHLALVREALHERERLLRSAPHLVRPLPMLIPFYPDMGVPPWQLRLGVWLYGRMAGRSTLPRARRLREREALAAFPGLRARDLRGGLLFHDARTDDARLTLLNVRDAVAHGASFVNHAEVVGVDVDGLRVVDRVDEGGREFTLRTRQVANAAGPALDRLRRVLGVDGDDLIRHSRGSHVVLPPREGELALTAFLPDGRIQFVVPHDGGTLCGTTDVDDPLAGDETGPPEPDLDYLLDALGGLFEVPPTRSDVRFAYSGWRALPRVAGPPGALHREAFVVSERLPCGELHSVVGGKLTTHRALAERFVAARFAMSAISPTRTRSLPGGDGPREVESPLWWRHGSRSVLVQQLAAAEPEGLEPICAHRPFLVAELALALGEDGAVRFADVMLRRLCHVLGPCLEPSCLQRAYRLFCRYRRVVVDDDEVVAIAALRREVAVVTGALGDWAAGGAGA